MVLNFAGSGSSLSSQQLLCTSLPISSVFPEVHLYWVSGPGVPGGTNLVPEYPVLPMCCLDSLLLFNWTVLKSS